MVKSIGWTLGEIALYLSILAAIYLVIAALFVTSGLADPNASNANFDPYNEILLDYLPLLVGSIIGIWIVHQLIFKRTFRFSGWTDSSGLVHFLKGTLFGFVLISLGFIILFLTKLITVTNITWDSYLFVGLCLFFLIQSSVEEYVLRSFLLPTISNRFNIQTGIVSTSLIFTLLHIFNPNISILSLTNLFLAGLLLSIVYFKFRSIYFPIGLHFGWNFFQGSFYGFEVSGLDVYSYLNSNEHGLDWITGGAFGLEGSFIASLLLVLSLIWFYRKSPNMFKGQYLSSLPSYSV